MTEPSDRPDDALRASRASRAFRAFRGSILHFLGDPGSGHGGSEYIEDGLLLVEEGRVLRIGPAAALLATLPAGTPLVDHTGCLLLPGFIDTHIHHAQTDVIASGGSTLLDWLERHTFPAERRFADAPAEILRDIEVLAEVRGIGEELLRDAADVDAGTAEAAAFRDCDARAVGRGETAGAHPAQ